MNISYILYILIVILLISVFRIVVTILLSMNTSLMQKKRNKQLEGQNKKKVKSEEESQQEIRQVINKFTNPIANQDVIKRRVKNPSLLAKKLRLAGYDKYFTPLTWTAFSTALQVFGTIMFLLLFRESKIFAGLFFTFFAIMPNFLLNNSYNNYQEELLISFPETINVISGYLSAGLIMQQAFAETAKNASPEWKILLEKFVAKANATDIITALDWFKDEVGIVEAREFFATVRLSLELGGSVKSGFAEQADRIQKLLRDAMQKKIERRKVWATIVQGPILLCVMAIFGLPLVGAMKDIF